MSKGTINLTEKNLISVLKKKHQSLKHLKYKDPLTNQKLNRPS